MRRCSIMRRKMRPWWGSESGESLKYPGLVGKSTVRMSLDIPVVLHRRLHAVAAREGCSARQLILLSIERAVEEAAPNRPRRRLRLDPPIVPSTGKPFDLTSEQIYDLIEFP